MIKDQMIAHETIIKQGEGNIVSNMDGAKVMLNIQNGKYYNLGKLGGEIWDLLEQPVPVLTVINRLQAEYEVDSSECGEQVITFLSQLLDEDLIQIEA